ncbi:MAG: hypothetical protein R2773_03190 [Flavobacteriaceae bacterium]
MYLDNHETRRYTRPLAVIMKISNLLFFSIVLFTGCHDFHRTSNSTKKPNSSTQDLLLFCSTENHQKAIGFVSQNWGLQARFLLCESLPPKLVKKNWNKIKVNNDAIWKKYDSIFKTDSQKKFYDDIAKEIVQIQLATEVLGSNEEIKQFLSNLKGAGVFIGPSLHAKNKDSIYVWRIWENLDYSENKKYDEGIYADIEINLKNKKVKIIEFKK